MRAVVQRVSQASVRVDDELKGNIEKGLLVFVGVEKGDTCKDITYIASKVAGLRIFEDEEGKMNLDVRESGGKILLVSQFTLAGDARKGRRPSFIQAEEPNKANEMIEQLIQSIASNGISIEQGQFQAHMSVELVNDGPVTILLDSRKRF